MYNRNDINPEVEEKILKNYQEILNIEINHPENVVTLRSVEEIRNHFDSL